MEIKFKFLSNKKMKKQKYKKLTKIKNQVKNNIIFKIIFSNLSNLKKLS
jgi:hypothetical protein